MTDLPEVTATEKTIEAAEAATLFRRTPLGDVVRNPERIPHMINLMLAAWVLYPDMRMGQLLMNAARFGGHGPNDIWNVEEEVFAQGLLRLIKEGNENAGS